MAPRRGRHTPAALRGNCPIRRQQLSSKRGRCCRPRELLCPPPPLPLKARLLPLSPLRGPVRLPVAPKVVAELRLQASPTCAG